MHSLQTIQANNQEAARKAAEADKQPYVIYDADEVEEMQSFPFPVIGDHEPEGWEPGETWMVDCSGFGADDEPALTIPQFRKALSEYILAHQQRVGFAIVSVGQFQLHVQGFKKKECHDHRRRSG
jgi:hypothetical protein